MHREQKLRLFNLHRKAQRVAFMHYLRKGCISPELNNILNATSSVQAFLKYNPDQPRVPAGSTGGGQWTSGDSEDGGDIADPTHVAQEEIPPEFEDIPAPSEGTPTTVKPPFDQYPTDPAQSPAPGFEWRGNGPPGSSQGNWHNPLTDEDLHPDLDHQPPIGPHWDYDNPSGSWRLYPDGRIEPKIPGFVLTA